MINSRRSIPAARLLTKHRPFNMFRRVPTRSDCIELLSGITPDKQQTRRWLTSRKTIADAASPGWVDPDDDDVDLGVEGDDGNTRVRDYTANEMEFFEDIQDELDEHGASEQAEKEERKRREDAQLVRDELDAKTGRLWSDPWEITDDDWSSKTTFEDLPDWSPDMCSRISMERVQVHPDGILTLDALANLPLPPPPPPHPGHGEASPYASHRKSYLLQQVYDLVVSLSEPRIADILKLPDWNEKQDKIDELFESIESELKEQETVLGKHPLFGEWVESSLERYLQSVEQMERKNTIADMENTAKRLVETKLGPTMANPNLDEQEKRRALELALRNEHRNLARQPKFDGLINRFLKQYDKNTSLQGGDEGGLETGEGPPPSKDGAVPIFMDLYDSNDGPSVVVPSIVRPLEPHARDGPGRMAEEWELAAHKETKRIMLRDCTREIARILNEEVSSRIVVTGRMGVGKTAALTAIVASARKSGYIVLFLPDGDRMKRNFYYIEPNGHRQGMFDLPILSKEVCGQFRQSHEKDLDGMTVNSTTIETMFTESQIKRLPIETPGTYPVVELLRIAEEHESWAPMCYTAVVHTLMNQSEKPFLMVFDEFNSHYDCGEYFHMEYDETVRKPIPPEQVSLFEPAMNALGLSTSKDAIAKPTLSVKKGGILVGMTESKAVSRGTTDALVESARRESADPDAEASMHLVDVPRYSILEADHIVSNMESIGIGRLRFDRGDTIMNDNEVAYLRMVSGGAGQALLDACIL